MSAEAAAEARKRNNAQKQQINYWRKQAESAQHELGVTSGRLSKILGVNPDADAAAAARPDALPGETGAAAEAAAEQAVERQRSLEAEAPDPMKLETADDLVEHEKFALARIYAVQATARATKRPQDELKAITEALKMANRIGAKMERKAKEAGPDEVLAVVLPNRGEVDFPEWCRRNGIRMSSGEPVPLLCGTCKGTGVEPPVVRRKRA